MPDNKWDKYLAKDEEPNVSKWDKYEVKKKASTQESIPTLLQKPQESSAFQQQIRNVQRPTEVSRQQKEESTPLGQFTREKLTSGTLSALSGIQSLPNLFKGIKDWTGDKVGELVGKAMGATDEQIKEFNTARKSTELNLLSDIANKSKEIVDLGKVSREYTQGVTDDQEKEFGGKDIAGLVKGGEVGKAAKKIYGYAVESAPQIAATAIGGPSGLAVMSSGIAANKYDELKNDPNLKDVPEGAKLLNAAGTGVANFLFERYLGDIQVLKGAKKILIGGKEVAEEEAKHIVKNAFIDNMKKVVSKAQPITTPMYDAIGEMGTQFSENALNKVTTNPDQDLTEGLTESFLAGLGSSGAIIGGAKLASTIKNVGIKSKVAELEKSRDAIQQDIDSGNINDSQKEVLTNKVESINDEITDLAKQDDKQAKVLSDKDKQEIYDINKRLEESNAVLENKEVSDETKAEVQSEVDKLNQRLQELNPTEDATKIISEQQQKVNEQGGELQHQGTEGGQQEIGQGEGGERQATLEQADNSDSNIISEEGQEISQELTKEEYDAIDQEALANYKPTEQTEDKKAEILAKREAIKAEISRKLKEQRGQLSAGFDPSLLKDFIELAKTHIDMGIINGREMIAKLREDYKGMGLDDSKIKDNEFLNIHAQALNEKGLIKPEGKTRGFIESLSQSKDFKEFGKMLENNPDSKYTPQNENEIKDKLSNLSDTELDDLLTTVETNGIKDGEDNIGIAAGIERANRAVNNGDTAKADQIFTRLAKLGTGLGQLVRQFAGLKKVNPKSFVQAFENRLKKGGRKPLTDDQKAKLEGLFNEFKKSKNDLDVALESGDKKQIADVGKLHRKNGENLDNYMKKLSPRNVFKTGESVLQGNFLIPKSLLQNPLSNLTFQVLKTLEMPFKYGIDQVLSLATGEKTRTGLSAERLKTRWEGVKEGTRLAKEKLFYGNNPKELEKMGVSGGLKPLEAWKRLFSSESTAPDLLSKVNEKASDLLEGTGGLPAEAMLRGLAWGDDPFKLAVYRDRLYTEGRLKGLKGQELQDFIDNPDKTSQERAERIAEESVLQDSNKVADMIENFRKGLDKVDKSGASGFVLRSIAPYTKTPLNYLYQYVKYKNPVLPLALGVKQLADLASVKSQIKKAKMQGGSGSAKKIEALNKKATDLQIDAVGNLATATVGYIIGQVISQVIGKGIVSTEPSGNEKERQLQYATQYPNTINASSLIRGLNTGDFSQKEGDSRRKLSSLGVIGDMVFAMEKEHQKLGEEKFKAKQEEENNRFLDALTKLKDSTFGPFLQQSFVKGLSSTMDLFKDLGNGRTDAAENFFSNVAKSMSHVVIPNTWTASLRARREYLPDFKGDTMSDKFLNAVKSQYAVGSDYPIRRDLYGRPVKLNQVEAGSPAAYYYQLIDFTGEKRVENDPKTFELYKLYNESGKETGKKDISIIPSIPKATSPIDKEKKLTRVQFDKLTKYIGEERGRLMDELLSSGAYTNAELEEKIEMVKGVNDEGRTIGMEKFIAEEYPDYEEQTEEEE